ncbi:MAG TPA: dihydrolipoyl dehydrogenase, partial [Paenalcaligenes sp.]|nr:dihydrolipoyl dehydrogenase [Paenalcaligenes sp.]
AGQITELLVQVGDKVSTGDAIAVIELSEDEPSAQDEEAVEKTTPGHSEQAKPAAASTAAAAAPTDAPSDAVDLVVLGAGPGGYSAAFRAADLGLEVVLVERYDTLGGVCLNVGCIPSKSLLHTISAYETALELKEQGISFKDPDIDLDAMRAFKDSVIGKLTRGLAGMAKARKVRVVQGVGTFEDAHHLRVEHEGKTEKIAFRQAIIAAGSRAIHLPFMPEDERIIDSTGALKLKSIPERMLVIGGGIIGLEMATVYAGLGTKIDVVEMLPGLMQGADRDLVKIWQNKNAWRFENIWLQAKTVAVRADEQGVWAQFEGADAPTDEQRYDLILQSVGRAPNGDRIGAENAGIAVDERGFLSVDRQMRTNVPHIFAIGDIIGQPMLAHKAVHEGHVAAEVAAGQKSHFDARVIPSVAYTDPEVAWVGVTQEEAKAQGLQVKIGLFPWMASGRAIANARDEGVTKLIFDEQSGRIIGGAIVGTGAGDMIGEVALAIEMGADEVDIAQTIHPHPTLGESISMAAAASLGVCTDLPPQRR